MPVEKIYQALCDGAELNPDPTDDDEGDDDVDDLEFTNAMTDHYDAVFQGPSGVISRFDFVGHSIASHVKCSCIFLI